LFGFFYARPVAHTHKKKKKRESLYFEKVKKFFQTNNMKELKMNKTLKTNQPQKRNKIQLVGLKKSH